jgi:hypothetical protein
MPKAFCLPISGYDVEVPERADAVKTALNAAQAGAAFLAISLAFSAAVLAAPDDKTPAMTLISTDTGAPYPFAAIEVNHTVYHVTEGDVLDGVYIRHIVPGRVTLSSDQVLVEGQPRHPNGATAKQPLPKDGSRAISSINR